MSAASPAPERPDEALVQALRSGDEAAFAAVVRRYGGPLLSTARRFLGEEEARDAVQDAFLKAHQSLPGFQGSSSFYTWMHRILVNTCLMRIRSRNRHPEESLEDLLPRFAEDGHEASPTRPWREPAEFELPRRELGQLVRGAIQKLPEMYRVVVLLRDIEELDTAETADALGITENAVKIRLHRARQALRALLAPSFQERSAP